MKDYYAILAVDRAASTHTIKLAYRRIAMQLHPDRNAGGEQQDKESTSRMVDLNEAYEVLSNAALRQQYDIEWSMTSGAQLPPPETPASPPASGTPGPATSESAGSAAPAAAPTPAFGAITKQTSEEYRRRVLNQFEIEWKEDKLDGFNWACTAGNWRNRYTVAGKPVATLRAAEAGNIFSHASIAVGGAAKFLCTNHFLFLVFYEKAAELEGATAALRRISALSNSAAIVIVGLVDCSARKCTLLPDTPMIKDTAFRALLTNFSRS